jgi:hypothetical protein
MTAKTLWMAVGVAIALVPLSGRPTREARPLVFPITNATGKSVPLYQKRKWLYEPPFASPKSSPLEIRAP